MCEWFNEEGYRADIDALEAYLREHGWEEKEGMAATLGWVKAL